ncbi:hypothetical protein KVG29_04435 [Caldicoprobacter algeriensis]|uniref:DUF6470 family protein n=1 Tax=Caldicoprobacter algeriensis TaxID=699281 RepID=UPI00207AD528|nr:DUF6470 family protein [Caldicoprobacter algeriensis]MCM8900474.1 hypothetical protein [Caldicoprobacter algeriensis]
MHLCITTTPALIGIRTQPSRVEIKSSQPLVEMKRQPPRLNMETEPVRVHIDQYECFAELGYKNFLDLARAQAQKGYQRLMEYIAQTAQDGDRLAAIELGGNPIADIAKEKSYHIPEAESVKLPFPKPKFYVTGGVSIDYQPGKVHFNVVVHPVRYRVTPHKVEIYMRQYPSITIEYVGHYIDRRV